MSKSAKKYNRMTGKVKKKKAFLIFFTLLFSMLFITLLRSQPCTRAVRGWFLKVSPTGANDTQSSMVFLPSDGRRGTRPAGRIELTPAPERCGEHNIGGTGLELAGGQVRRDTCHPPDYWLDELIRRLWIIESGGQLNPCPGDDGKAIGPLQIHPAVVKDVNKFCGARFSLEDRRDLAKSKEIARLYITYWMQRHREEIASRIWNGGPRGWQKKTTDEYWQKMQNLR